MRGGDRRGGEQEGKGPERVGVRACRQNLLSKGTPQNHLPPHTHTAHPFNTSSGLICPGHPSGRAGAITGISRTSAASSSALLLPAPPSGPEARPSAACQGPSRRPRAALMRGREAAMPRVSKGWVPRRSWEMTCWEG